MAGGEIRGKLGLDKSDFDRGLAEAQAQVEEFSKGLIAGLGVAGGFEIGQAIIEGLKGVPEAIAGAIDHVAELSHQFELLSEKTGVAVGSLQELSFAATVSGTSIDSVASLLTKMEKNLVTGKGALQDLGLSAAELKEMAPEAAFQKIADAIQGMDNPMAQAAAAMKIFGKAGAEMLPMIKGGMADARLEAQQLGTVLSDETVKASADLKIETEKLGLAWDGLKNQFAGFIADSPEIIDALQGITRGVGAVASGIRDHHDELEEFLLWVLSVGNAASGAVANLSEMAIAGGEAASLLGTELEQGPAPRTPIFGPRDAPQGIDFNKIGYGAQQAGAAGLAGDKAAQAEQADFTRRQIELEKQLADAYAGGTKTLDQEIAKIQAQVQATAQQIEADTKLTAAHKAQLIDDLALVGQAKENATRDAAAKTAATETTKLYAAAQADWAVATEATQTPLQASISRLQQKRDAEVENTWRTIEAATADGTLTDAELKAANARIIAANAALAAGVAKATETDAIKATTDAAKIEYEVDTQVETVNRNLAQAYGYTGNAIDEQTQKQLDHIMKLENEVLMSDSLTDAQKELAFSRLTDAEAIVVQTGEQQKLNEATKGYEEAIKGLEGALSAFGLQANAVLSKLISGFEQLAKGIDSARGAMSAASASGGGGGSIDYGNLGQEGADANAIGQGAAGAGGASTLGASVAGAGAAVMILYGIYQGVMALNAASNRATEQRIFFDPTIATIGYNPGAQALQNIEAYAKQLVAEGIEQKLAVIDAAKIYQAGIEAKQEEANRAIVVSGITEAVTGAKALIALQGMSTALQGASIALVNAARDAQMNQGLGYTPTGVLADTKTKAGASFAADQSAITAAAQIVHGMGVAGGIDTEVTQNAGILAQAAKQQAYDAAIAGGQLPAEAEKTSLATISPLLTAQLNASMESGVALDSKTQALIDEAKANDIHIVADPMIELVDIQRKLLAIAQAGNRDSHGVPLPGGSIPNLPGTNSPVYDPLHPPVAPPHAKGGYIPATSGGRAVTVGEGGEGEWIIPESKMGMHYNPQITINASGTRAEPAEIGAAVAEALRQDRGELTFWIKRRLGLQ
jgi:hypothetical protein